MQSIANIGVGGMILPDIGIAGKMQHMLRNTSICRTYLITIGYRIANLYTQLLRMSTDEICVCLGNFYENIKK